MGDLNRGNENIADVVSLEPYASPEAVREALINVIRWLGDREPVAPGDPFLKFTTGGQLVELGLVTEGDILGDDDGGEDDDGSGTEPEYVVVHAREMYPSATDGCDVLTSLELTAAKPNIQFLEFNALADSSAEFQLIMPFGWPGNAFQFRVYWSHPTGAGTVVWKLQAHSATDQEAIGSDFADGGKVTDDGGTADTLYITAESTPITISGVNAKAGDLIFLRISRLASSDAADDLNVAARLHAIRFNLGEAQVEFPDVLGFDPVWTDGYYSYSINNTAFLKLLSGHRSAVSVVTNNTGKRYLAAKVTIQATPDSFHIGLMVVGSAVNNHPGFFAGNFDCQFSRVAGVGKWASGSFSTLASSTICGLNDTAMVAVDFDAGKIWYGRNGTWYNSGNPVTGANPSQTFTPNTAMHIGASDTFVGNAQTYYFTGGSAYPAPSGFTDWDL